MPTPAGRKPTAYDQYDLDPEIVRILMLTDDDGSFSKEHRFGLSELVDALQTQVKPYVKFAVTRAHRLNSKPPRSFPYPKDADIQDFRFDNPAMFDPTAYDQIWLFGVANRQPDTGRAPYSEAEKRILFQFMNAGGGVFATGDHEDLGMDLCGEIPRVRSMRRWKFTAPPNGDYNLYVESPDQAPPVLGPHRHDTLVKSPGDTSAEYRFDDQSDDIPAPIEPVMYVTSNSAFTESHPHPLLCGPRGTIRVLPDHMHEGECEVPTDLGQTVAFDGYKAAEYPLNILGRRPVPQVVAYGVVSTGHKTRLDRKDLFRGSLGDTSSAGFLDVGARADRFGAIGAYDGHIAGVGRVVVDSTFHHFFNINLVASESNNNVDPAKMAGAGLNYSAQGRDDYERIKAYYRNIANWIARPQRQTAMLGHVLWTARWDSQMRMYPHRPGMTEKLSWPSYLDYGGAVRQTMARIASACSTLDWNIKAIDPLALLLPNWLYVLIHTPDPPPIDYTKVLVEPDAMVRAALAGIMAEIVKAAPERTRAAKDKFRKDRDSLIARGVAVGLRRAVAEIESQLDMTRRYLDLMRERANQASR